VASEESETFHQTSEAPEKRRRRRKENLMTTSKWFVLVVITAIAILEGAALADFLTKTSVYTGTDVKFTVSPKEYIVIEAESVNAAAASSDFFTLRKVTGETLVPTPQKPPFSWNEDTYYAVGPVTVPGGHWLVAAGEPIIEITNATPVTVRIVHTDDDVVSNRFFAGYLGFVFWLISLLILGSFGFYQDS
jgi:hypothetical protein